MPAKTIPIEKYRELEVKEGAEVALRTFQKDVGSNGELNIVNDGGYFRVAASDIDVSMGFGWGLKASTASAVRETALHDLLSEFIDLGLQRRPRRLRIGGDRIVNVSQTHLTIG